MQSRLEDIGSAAAGIAHDLNNQLTLVLNHLSVSDLEGARNAASRCCALTKTLLAYSAGETPALESVDSIAFVRNFLAELKLPREIRIVLNSPKALPELDADPVALHRILSNLVDNAVTAMNGAGILRLVLRAGSISVEDTGPGIPAENLARVFQPFFTTRGAEGTGLGLAVVRDIMRRHGGSVAVRSQPGEGSQFHLRFRLRPSY